MRRLAVLLLIGCAHTAQPRAAPPPTTCNPTRPDVEVEFAGRTLEEAGFNGSVLGTTWRVTNPYRVPVTVSRWNHRVTATGVTVPGTQPDPTVTVPARSCQNVQLKQRLDYQALFGPTAPPSGSFLVSVAPLIQGGPHGDVELQVTESGFYDMARLPTLSVGRLHVEKGGERFSIDLDLLIANPNGFPVTIERVEGELLISGNRFSRLVAQPMVIGGYAQQVVPFKLTSSIDRLNGLARAALSSTEAISTDVKVSLTIEGRTFAQSTGGMIYPR